MILKNLTECEQLVMKTVWDAADELGLMEIMERTNNKYHKKWAPQTVSTFLSRLVRKGYLRHYRQGRVFLYRVMIPLEEYKAQLTKDYVDFWDHGNADEFLRDLARRRPLRPDEIDRIRTILNGVGERREGESMKRVITTITCDRCGREITGCPVRIMPHHVPRKSESEADKPEEGTNELPPWIDRMVNKDFCEECTEDIVVFALNRDTCDECVDGILDSVNERTEEDEPDDPEGTPDTENVDWNAALNRMEQEYDAEMDKVAQISQTCVNPVDPQEAGKRFRAAREGGEEPEEDADQEKKKQTGRKKLDHGKIMALHRAGWSNAKIAEEMGTTKGTISVTISKYKDSVGGNT